MTGKRLVALILAALLALSTASALAASRSIAIDANHFPNSNFRRFVKGNFDSNGDGYLSNAECSAVRKIVLDFEDDTYGGRTYANLKGIEYFTNLTELRAGSVGLSKLDVKKNSKLTVLYVPDNNLTALDVRKNTKLKLLECARNRIRSLKLGNNSKLEDFVTEGNRISSINVHGCTKLKKIFASHCIQESGGSSMLWRLSHPFQVITDASTTIKDGKKVLYKKSSRVKSISPVKKNVTLRVGQTWSPAVKVKPSSAAIRDYQVLIGDDTLLECPYDDGTLKAVKKGSTTVTIQAKDYKNRTITAKIKVTIQ